MKITVPAGSIVIMPKNNTPETAFRTTAPITIDRDDVEIFDTLGEYLIEHGDVANPTPDSSYKIVE